MASLDGKVALVSGAARGLGAAIAKRLAEAGARVIVGDLNEESGRATAAAITSAGGGALFVHHDVTSEAAWRAAVGTAVDRFGGLDVLVNNAGIFFAKATEETTLEEWRRISAVNLDGVFLGTKVAVPAMKERARTTPAGGSIVNISSTAGITGTPIAPAYSMTKGGVRSFTKSTALEFARRGYRIRVNSVHPGLTKTEMAKQVVAGVIRLGFAASEGESYQSLVARHPLGRLGVPDDVAAAVLFLASDDSAYITGPELVVDGGFTAQ